MTTYIAVVVTLILVHQLFVKGPSMSDALDKVKAAAAREHTITLSVIALVKSLADQVNANKDDPAALEELAAEINADADALSAAVHENSVNVTAVSDETPTSGGTAGDGGSTVNP